MRFTTSLLAAIALALTFTHAAVADSIQLTVNSTITANVSSSSDSYWGELINVPSSPYSFGGPLINSGRLEPIPDISVFVPDGSLITSAVMSLVFQNYTNGPATLVAENQFGALEDHSIPSVAPVFQPATVQASVSYHLLNPGVLIVGNEVSTNLQNGGAEFSGNIFANGYSGGTNWAGFIGGYGQVNIPYTVTLDVTYTPAPVPEPSSIALLGTGLLGLASIARRKLLS